MEDDLGGRKEERKSGDIGKAENVQGLYKNLWRRRGC